MKPVATIARSLRADMAAELRSVPWPTRDAGRGLKVELRRQVTSGGLASFVANRRDEL